MAKTVEVKRSQHFTECSGLIRPEGSEELQKFDGELVPGYRSIAECERHLRKLFDCPVIIETCKRVKKTYTMDLQHFVEEATESTEYTD